MIDTLSQYLNFSSTEVNTLLALSLQGLLDSPNVQQQLDGLNVELLRETLPTAGAVLATHLPPFYDWLQNELGVVRVPDSPDHTTQWVVNFLNNRESLIRLVELHRPVPRIALERSIPRLVGLFAAVEDDSVRQAWQTAVSALCLVLAVAARHEEHTHLVGV
ncbi:MAG: hypothetical protein HC935_07565 [Pseudanabaena sp. SU_2_4]|nr:hypothetical protein [Pseudanabaena sp. SU_2_4]